MSQPKTFTNRSEELRLDLFLAQNLADWSRRKIRRLIDVGGVYLNDQRVRVASRVVRKGARVKIIFNEELVKKDRKQLFTFSAEHILCENDAFIAINKPIGLAAQATQDQAIDHVVPALERFRVDLRKKLFLVHRLDKETSGVLILAKSKQTVTELTELFRERTIKKVYLALAYGKPIWKTTKVENYLSDINKKTGLVEVVRAGGKQSTTSFTLEKVLHDGKVSLIRCFPETGRTHQIRVHLASLGHGIVGDKKYGTIPKNMSDINIPPYHLLHACELAFEFPQGQQQKISAPQPAWDLLKS